MKPTIKDIAKEAGVSITTVSLVLNNRPNRIPESTKKKIHDAAKKLKYAPNFTARNLVMKKTKTIGVMIPDIENPFFSEFVKIVDRKLKMQGYTIMISNSDDKFENDVEIINNFISRGADGLLLTISNESYSHLSEIKSVMQNISVPYVLVDRIIDGIQCHKVSFDNKLGGYLATKYAIDEGKKNIACIMVKNQSNNSKARFEGYKEALNEFNIEFNISNVYEGEYKFKSGYLLADQILCNESLEAVVACNDMAAYGIVKKAKEFNISVPNQILIIGYDNLELSKMFDVHLPSVEQDVNQLGETATTILIEAMNTPIAYQTVTLTPVIKVD